MRLPILLLFLALVLPTQAEEPKSAPSATDAVAQQSTDTSSPAEDPESPGVNDSADTGEPDEPQEITGKIVGVASGDTLTILVDTTPTVVRIAGVDAPELDQPYGNHAKRILTSRFAGKVATVTVEKRDPNGIAIGEIKIGKQDIGLQMLRVGMAWHSKEEKDTLLLAKAEAAARKSKRGLWRDASAIAPWRWRDKDAEPEETAVAETGTDKPAASPTPAISPPTAAPIVPTGYWLNTRSNVRHNQRCEYFNNTSQGRYCSARDGKRCGYCGG